MEFETLFQISVIKKTRKRQLENAKRGGKQSNNILICSLEHFEATTVERFENKTPQVIKFPPGRAPLSAMLLCSVSHFHKLSKKTCYLDFAYAIKLLTLWLSNQVSTQITWHYDHSRHSSP